ncbi:uncharacterized protein LOC106092234 [Stomoxys calcitrans]|uniref:Uncharacterized protein n=1 Tax=Stomoxys calcitrans TaxID=35570 RepID=A0A1I8PB89_STOCA|nr:uncharacterized protein LOC106092234 [Stomoxys calcitrans]
MCCCISLRMVSLLVGWMHVLYASTAICLAIYLDYYAKRKLAKTPKYDEFVQVETIIFALYLMLNVFRLVIAGFLIRGIMKERRSLLAPYVYGQCVILILFVSLVVIDALYDLKDGKDNAYSFLDLALDVTYATLTALFLWPVYSLYQKMDYSQQRSSSTFITDTTTSHGQSVDV